MNLLNVYYRKRQGFIHICSEWSSSGNCSCNNTSNCPKEENTGLKVSAQHNSQYGFKNFKVWLDDILIVIHIKTKMLIMCIDSKIAIVCIMLQLNTPHGIFRDSSSNGNWRL